MVINLIVWLMAGLTGGRGAGDYYRLGPGSMVAGAIGGVVGALIFQVLIPDLGGIRIGPLIVQLIVAVVSGAVLTVIAKRFLKTRGY